MVHIQYTFYYFSANKKYPLFSILYHYITKLLNCLYVKMKWNSVIVEQILHKFKKLPWWTFHLLLPGACSQLSFPLTWPQQLPYARLNTKRLKPKFLDHFSKRPAPKWSTKIENYFPQTNFSNYLGFPLPRPDSRSRAVEPPP